MPIQTTDEVLLEALRARMKRQLEKDAERQAISNVINNYSGGESRGGGVMAALGGTKEPEMMPGEDPYDYMVRITKNDKLDPVTNKAKGWDKRVHRYRIKKGEDDPYSFLDGEEFAQLKKKGVKKRGQENNKRGILPGFE